MGETKAINSARYIHGDYGKGTWTFYGGHDPEDHTHRVSDPPTDLNLYPNIGLVKWLHDVSVTSDLATYVGSVRLTHLQRSFRTNDVLSHSSLFCLAAHNVS